MSIDLRTLFPNKSPAELERLQAYLDEQKEKHAAVPANDVTDLWEYRARKEGAVVTKRNRFKFFQVISEDKLYRQLTAMNQINLRAYENGELPHGRQIHP